MGSSNKVIELGIPSFIREDHAACSDVDPELFFPQEVEISPDKIISRYVNMSAAKQVCNGCPLKMSCLDYSLKNHVLGIWGGLTETQRESLRKSRGMRLNRRTATPDLV